MGWYYSRQTREQLIDELIQPQVSEHGRVEVIAHTLHGDVLWSVVRVTAYDVPAFGLAAGESATYIRCDLLNCRGEQWGYKPLDECMHPYYYSCPLHYLDMAPERCREWRERVRAYHEQRPVRGEPANPATA